MLYEQFGELKYKYRNWEFWCKGYYVDTVGKNEAGISEYISKQLEEDVQSKHPKDQIWDLLDHLLRRLRLINPYLLILA